MSIEFIDGFDHYYNSAVNMQRKWDFTSNGGGFIAGRFGGYAMGWNNSVGAVKTLSSSLATRTMGFAFYCTGLASTYVILTSFQDGGTTQVDLRLLSTGQLQITRAGTVLGASSVASPIVSGSWYYIEWQATIDPTAGAVTIHVTSGGVTSTWLTLTSVNTRNTANSSANQITIQAGGSGGACYFDDFYLLNPSGSVNNTFLGESQIFTSFPSGDDASYKQWTPSAGTNHYANVNENPPDDDTTYNASSTPGNIDMFTFPSISPTGPVICTQAVLTLRKDAVGARTVSEQCKSGATVFTGGQVFSPTSNYLMYMQLRETDPNTSAAWTLANLNASENGVKLVS